MKRSLITLIAVCTFTVIIPSYAFSDVVDDYCLQPANQIAADSASELRDILATPPVDSAIVDGRKLLCFDPQIIHSPRNTTPTFNISSTDVIIHGLNVVAAGGVISNPLINISGSNVVLRNSTITDGVYLAGESTKCVLVSGNSNIVQDNVINSCKIGIAVTGSQNQIGPDNVFTGITKAIDISTVSADSYNYVTLNDIEFSVPAANRVYTGDNAALVTLDLIISADAGTVNIWKSKPDGNDIVNKIVGSMPSNGLVEIIGSDGSIQQCTTLEVTTGVYDTLGLTAGSFVYECADLNISTSHYISLIFASNDSGQYTSGGFAPTEPHVVDIPDMTTTPGPIALSPESVQGGEQQVIIENPGDTSGGDGDGFVGMGAAKTCSLTTINMTNNATAGAILIAILTALSPALVMVAIRKRRK